MHMRTLEFHFRFFAAAATLGLMATTLSGCGCLVSRKHYLDTAFGKAPQRTSYRVGGPNSGTAGSKIVVIPSADRVVDDEDGDDVIVSPAAAVGVQALTADQQRYIASVNNQVTAMTTRMNELAASAKIKGAAGEAALAPRQRAFNQTTQQMQSRIDAARSLDAAGWTALETEVNELLKQAQKSVDDAIRDVEAVPTNK
jgi:hypothetical protein